MCVEEWFPVFSLRVWKSVSLFKKTKIKINFPSSLTLTLFSLCSCLYQIAHLGDDDGEPEFSSSMQLEEGETFFFAPRPLKNLVQVDELESLSPIMACQIADLAGEDTPQLYVACGRGPRSSLRVLRHGLEVSYIPC